MENYSYYYPYNPNTINHDKKPPPSSSSSSSKNSKIKSNNQHHNHNRGKRAPPKLSTDPQSVAARERRHRISDRFKILQTLVPGGTKLDTVSLLEHAIQYVKFLKAQIWLHQAIISPRHVSNYDNNNNNIHHDGDYDCNYGINDVIYPSYYDNNRPYDDDKDMYYGLINGNDGVNHDYYKGESSNNMMMGTSQVATAIERGMPHDLSSLMDDGSYDHHQSLCFNRSFNYY